MYKLNIEIRQFWSCGARNSGNWGYLEPVREINDYESDTGKGKAKNYSRRKSGERVAYYGYLCNSIYGRGRKVTTDG